MLIVKVFTNNKMIDEIIIQNVSKEYKVGIQKYKIVKPAIKEIIKHKYSDGYMSLLQKVLKVLNKKERN